MIWVYAVCERPELPPPRRRGLAQAPLEGVIEGQLLAVVTKHVHAPGEPALDALWAHERVVERLMAERAVLPMRFGTKLPDAAALRAALAARYDALRAALDGVRGRVELGVRAMELAGEDGAAATGAQLPAHRAPATTGREYLLAKLAYESRIGQTAAALHEPLMELAVDARRRAAQGANELLRASYLVDRDTVPRFRATVERLQRQHPRVALLCTGPWPPYSFIALPQEPRRPAPARGSP
jgi:hypothetical protein